MVSVVGPLFSLSASGTFKKALVFSVRNGKTVVGSTPTITLKRSSEQLLHSQKVRELSQYWSSLPELTKTLWSDGALGYGGNGYRYFWAEWFLQNSTSQNPPVLP